MKNFTWIIIFSLVLFGCNRDTVYEKFNRDFPDNRWMKQDIRSYDFTVEEASEYDILIDFSHVHNTPLTSVPVGFSLHQEQDVLSDELLTIIIRDEDGNQVGECMGDYCDILQTALSRKKLVPGNYTIRLTNKFDFDYMPNILGIGVRVVKRENQ